MHIPALRQDHRQRMRLHRKCKFVHRMDQLIAGEFGSPTIQLNQPSLLRELSTLAIELCTADSWSLLPIHFNQETHSCCIAEATQLLFPRQKGLHLYLIHGCTCTLTAATLLLVQILTHSAPKVLRNHWEFNGGRSRLSECMHCDLAPCMSLRTSDPIVLWFSTTTSQASGILASVWCDTPQPQAPSL